MKLIIEAGSSKTESRLIDPICGVQKKNSSPGINPVTDPQYEKSIESLAAHYEHQSNINEIHYYGSGCINQSVNDQVKEKLQNHFTDTSLIEVADDLVGSAKATCKDAPGLVCIVGTGSIIGYYNGHEIVDKLPSAGYLIGDEGSGFHIGKTILRRYLRGQLEPIDIQALNNEIRYSNSQLIEELYRNTNPRKYLASYAPLIHLIDPEAKKSILNEVFGEMTKNMIVPMASKRAVKTHFIGSIAFYFKDLIAENLQKFDIIAGSFQQSAIEGLVQYHHHEKRN